MLSVPTRKTPRSRIFSSSLLGSESIWQPTKSRLNKPSQSARMGSL
ncbi:Uncharacterised protein [Vibrio cholerae]|nr:Uncharacterised protein [Vibrio cholerae]